MSRPRGPRPPVLELTEAERSQLLQLIQRHSTPQQLALRARLILAAAAGQNNAQIARVLGISVAMAREWRQRWRTRQPEPVAEQPVAAHLTDRPRPGAPARITAEQWCQIMALACSPPEAEGRPLSHWDARAIAKVAVEKGIVDRISPRHVGRFLKGGRPPAPPLSVLVDARLFRT